MNPAKIALEILLFTLISICYFFITLSYDTVIMFEFEQITP